MTPTAAVAEAAAEVEVGDEKTSDGDHYQGTNQEDVETHLPRRSPLRSLSPSPSPSDADAIAVRRAARMRARLTAYPLKLITEVVLLVIELPGNSSGVQKPSSCSPYGYQAVVPEFDGHTACDLA